MLFWAVTAVLTLIVVGTLSNTLLRGRSNLRPSAAYDLDVYRDQLKEVDRDLARGILAEADAERVRIEVSRRILSADTSLRNETSTLKCHSGPIAATMLSLSILAGSYSIYMHLGAPGYGDLALTDRIKLAEELRAKRPRQQTAEVGSAAKLPVGPPISPDYVTLVQKLRETVGNRPNDLQGQILLVQSEAQLGNFVAAHVAQARVIELKKWTATATDYSEYADLLILAAGGYVSPEAETVLEQALKMDPSNGTAGSYFGLMMAQTGRPDTALRIWDQLLRTSSQNSPWVSPIELQIDEIAVRAGVNYSRPAVPIESGPSAAAIEAASEMSPTERLEMIQGMVSGLSERLANDGGPVEDWARLISSLAVLGQMDEARTVFEKAQLAFKEDLPAIDILNNTASQVGLR
ncbi:MAG TPA: c-type cytochrome biogenesis protein CcmI [Rhodobacteraceae bacterium]|nr:c-type cytochrome biogenesis protein CcmI [Paracoccaceae bacterium]